MQMKIIFCSDLHGNLEQYKLLVKYSKAKQAQAIIIGGDLFPKRYFLKTLNFFCSTKFKAKTIASQLSFFKNDLFPILQDAAPMPIFVTLGNADFYVNMQHFCQFCANTHVHVLLNQTITILPATTVDSKPIKLLVYSGVPLTSHQLKDFERFDTHEHVPLQLSNTALLLRGACSVPKHELTLKYGYTEAHVSHDIKLMLKYGCNALQIPSTNLEVNIQRAFSIQSEMAQVLQNYDKNSATWVCNIICVYICRFG